MICQTINSMRRWLYLSMVLIFLLGNLTDNQTIQIIFTILLIVATALALPQSKKSNVILSIFLFIMGGLSLISAGAGWSNWVRAISANGGLVVLFISLPLFSILLSYNNYIKTVDKLFNIYVHKSFWFFTLAAILAGAIGAVMNLGGITLMYELLKPNLAQYGNDKQLAQALSRGNLSMSYWAPCHMSVATIVTYTGVPWIVLAPRGIILSLLQLFIIGITFYLTTYKKDQGIQKFVSLDKNSSLFSLKDKGVLLQLLGIYLGLIFIVAIINWQTKLPILAIITLTAFSYPLFIALVLSKKEAYLKGWQDYFINNLPKIVNQVVLFSAVGFFGKALELSGLGDKLIGFLNLDVIAQPIFLTAGVAFTMVILSLIGIHPLVSMIALATTLNSDLLGISRLSLAYTYLLGYSVGVIVSPFSAVALTISALNNIDPWNGISKHNLLYGFILIIVFSCIISFI